MKIKLADALLRRKELQIKVDALKSISHKSLFELKATRRQITDQVDDLQLQIPKLEAGQVTRELDWHSRQLRLVDSVIQQANWTTDVEIADSVMQDYQEEKKPGLAGYEDSLK